MMLLIIGFNLTVYKYIQQCYVLIIVIISILINKGFKINNPPPPQLNQPQFFMFDSDGLSFQVLFWWQYISAVMLAYELW